MDINALVDLSRSAGESLESLAKRDDEVGELAREFSAESVNQTMQNAFSTGSKKLRAASSRIKFTPKDISPNQDFSTTVMNGLRAQKVSEKLLAEAQALLAGKPNQRGEPFVFPEVRALPKTNADAANADAPTARVPKLDRLVELGNGARVGRKLGLSDKVLTRLCDAGVTIGRSVPGGTKALIDNKVITKKEAVAFERANTVARIFDGEPEFFENFGEYSLDPDTLVNVPSSQWAEMAKFRPDTAAIEAEDWGKIVEARIEATFPTQALRKKLRDNRDTLNGDLQVLNRASEMLKRPLITGGFLTRDEIKKLGEQGTAILESQRRIKQLDGKHPGFNIADTLENGQGGVNQRIELAQRQMRIAQEFLSNNEDFLSLNLTKGSEDISKLNFRGLDRGDRARALSFAQSYQRLYSIAKTPDLTAKVTATGHKSALSLANSNVGDLVTAGSLNLAEAGQIIQKATELATNVVGMFGGVLDGHKNWFDRLTFGSTPPGFEKVLKDIPGYGDFFGDQDYCDCSHCRSILSPAAYFVDLMRFIEDGITESAFTGREDHPLNLKVRRPDLWTLPLTCENTNELIPILQIVCEVVETFIASHESFAGDMSDLAEIGQFVYKDRLPNQVDSFYQPFVLPMRELAIFLSHDRLTLRDMADVIRASGATYARLGLALAEQEFDQIIVPQNTIGRLRKLYGHHFVESGGKITAFEPKQIYAHTAIGRDELGRAILTRFVTKDGADTISIRGAKRSAESVQNDFEQVHGMTRGALDRLRRLTLAARALGWTYDEIDVAHEGLQATGIAQNELVDSTLKAFVDLQSLMDKNKLSLEEALALVADIPSRAVTEDGTSLVDRLFNSQPYSDETPWPDASTQILLPAFAPTGTPVPTEVARLQAGLSLDDSDMANLVRALAGTLGIDPDAESAGAPDIAARSFSADSASLSLLYRHARLAELFDLDFATLAQLLDLAPGVSTNGVTGFTEIAALSRFVDYLDDSKRSVDDLLFMTGQTPSDSSLYPDVAALADDLVTSVATDNAMAFGSGVFTTYEGISETTSEAIIAANPALIVAAGEEYTLASGYAPSAAISLPADDEAAGIAVPSELRSDVSPLHDILNQYYVPVVIASRAALALDTRPEVFDAAIALLKIDLSEQVIINGLNQSGPITPLVNMYEHTSRLCLAMQNKALEAEQLQFLTDKSSSVFGISNAKTLGVLSLIAIDSFAKRSEDADADALFACLEGFDPAVAFASVPSEDLGTVLDCDPDLALSLHDAIDLPSNAFGALDALEYGVEIAQRLAIGGTTFAQISASDYDTLNAGSMALQAGLRSRYDTLEKWEEKIEDYRDQVLSSRRDGLVAYMVASIGGQFESAEDIYRYFLIDAQMEGCGRTSRVVSANSTLQLYVQRVMLNLEQTPADHSDPLHAQPSLVDEQEWSWRKNYRVWEANRRVFLYPENYLLPELRDNKTELFEVFEETVASQDINSETVRDAYASYMRGFEELSKLQISGAFLEKDTDGKHDILHMFGVTASDPARHFYRRVEDFTYGVTEANRATDWNSWREIDLKIPARKVSPIVHQGRLYVFWTEVSSSPRQKIVNGTSEFDGYNHKFRLLYSMRRLDGSWTEPQQLKLDNPPFYNGEGVVVDEAIFESVHYQNDVQHLSPVDGYTLNGFPWDRVYPEHIENSRSNIMIRGFDFRVNAPVDFHKMRLGDTLTSGVEDVRVPWIDPVSGLLALLFGSPIGFPSSNLLWSEMNGSRRELFKGSRPPWPYFAPYTTGSLLINRENFESISENRTGHNYMLVGTNPTNDNIWDNWESSLTSEIEKSFTGPRVIEFDQAEPDLQVINGAPNHAIIDVEGALFSLMDGAGGDDVPKYRLARLNSSLTDQIAETLFNRGVDAMLDIDAQNTLRELGLPFDIENEEVDDAPAKVGDVDYSGAMGVYLQEIYFHLPVLIAKTLNAQGDYADAREWFHKVFDPTSAEEITNIDPSLSEEDQERRKLDRVWKYRRFRDREVTSLRDILEDEAALETYRKDPFNPHAIARSRISAYQKYVVLSYVDNLLDEADALFATDMREQINEAVLLYVTALDILGPRPQRLGDCGEKIDTGLSYEDLQRHIDGDDDMLLEIETLLVNRTSLLKKTPSDRLEDALSPSYKSVEDLKLSDKLMQRLKGRKFDKLKDIDQMLKSPDEVDKFGFVRGVRDADYSFGAALEPNRKVGVKGPFVEEIGPAASKSRTRIASQGVGSVGAVSATGTIVASQKDEAFGLAQGTKIEAATETARLVGRFDARRSFGKTGATLRADGLSVPSFGMSIIRSVNPIFCVPENDALDGYWDRVEDRLFKIRNCMNIDGVKRPLSLFAPRIDPMMLVRARAAGLEISDLLGAGAGELPPFRFRFLLERARAATGSAKALGDAMQRALASKDAEELVQLRNTHQANILALGTELKEMEIANAETAIEELTARKAMVEARRDHYDDLMIAGDLPSETTQKASKVTAATLKAIGGGLTAASGFASLIPDVGAPTTIEWGGTQISAALKGSADTVKTLGEIADIVSMVAGMSASKERRYQGWAHQRSMAQLEFETFLPRETAATTRLDIAKRNLELHETQITNQDEIIEFYADKFSGLGLYSHLASTLQRLHKQAFNLALSYARLAETAYRFETGEDSFTIQATYWDANRAGLLASEKLSLDLATLEQNFIEGRRRNMEINQTFSLAQLDPAALMELRATGGANFNIPEWAFDLFYPGQYNRRTKAVRLTIPCVAGPYTNVSAQLTQTSSQIRPEPDLSVPLSGAPVARDTMIASSTAQADSGVFELNFRDDRYLPFEGSGAVSSWRIDMPSNFRPFNYSTITDVLVNISYTADYDAGLRSDVEDVAATLDSSLASVFADGGLRRVISLRQDASAAFQRLVASPENTSVDFEITHLHFPMFAKGRAISVSNVEMLIETGAGVTGTDAEFTLNTRPATGFAPESDYGGLLAASVSNAFSSGLINTHQIAVTDAGGLASGDGTAAMSHEAVKDILILIDYSVGDVL